MMQLDLLEWRPAEPAPTIIPFPMSRRIGEARVVAAKVALRIGDAQRQSIFCRAVSGLSRRLSRSGLDRAEVDRQLDAFTDLVNAELWRIEGRMQPPGSA